MLSLSELVRIYVGLTPTDMRKSFDSLAALVREGLGYDPLSGHLFVFRSRRGDRVKLLWWDRDGLAIYYKRLERGAFQFPRGSGTAVEITREGLLRLLSGMSISTRQIA